MFDESSCIEIYCVHICGRDNHGNKTYVYCIYIHGEKEKEREKTKERIATHPPPTINQPAIDR